MFNRKSVWILLLLTFTVLAACNSDDEEFEAFFNEMDKDVLGEKADPDRYIMEYIKHIENGEPAKALEVLNEKELPKNEKLVKKYKEMEFENEDLMELKGAFTTIFRVDQKKQEKIRDIFQKIMDQQEIENIAELDIDQELDDLSDIHKETVEVFENSTKLMQEVAEEYDQVEVNEEVLEAEGDKDPAEMNQDTNILIARFIEIVTGENAEELNEVAANSSSEEDDEKETDSQDDKDIEKMLANEGSTEVAFDAKAEIKDNHFLLSGKSNLMEGSTVFLHTYHYGAENPYLSAELEVDASGSFEMKEEMSDETLNGEPLTLRLAFQPDKEELELQEIYGEEGEKLEGPFAHKFTNIKRTRYGAFTYADLELENGAKTTFGIDTFSEPDDYGDMNIWMEKDHVETKDDYYIITMQSNLNELTSIGAEATVPGYETAGYTSRAKVRPDGSIRLHVPRPEVEGENVVIKFKAQSDGAIETEELYGEHGENFDGDLAVKKKQNTIIEYEVDLGKDS